MALKLHFREQGEGDQAIVLLHGLFGSSANWGSVASGLAEHYRVLIPDLRNHGQSPHDADNSYTAMAADVLKLLDQQHIRQALVVGHSMGGKVAMQLALDAPQRVAGLCVVDIAPVSYSHSFERVFNGFAAVDLAALQDRAQADQQMAEFITERAVRAFLLQNLVKVEGAWQWRVNLPALRAARKGLVEFQQAPGAVYPGPTSFIHGELSDYLQPSHRPAIKQYFPNASVCPVELAGHWVFADQPEGFDRCLQRFLDAV